MISRARVVLQRLGEQRDRALVSTGDQAAGRLPSDRVQLKLALPDCRGLSLQTLERRHFPLGLALFRAASAP